MVSNYPNCNNNSCIDNFKGIFFTKRKKTIKRAFSKKCSTINIAGNTHFYINFVNEINGIVYRSYRKGHKLSNMLN